MQILLLDPDQKRRKTVADVLAFMDHTVRAPDDPNDWAETLDEQPAECVVLVATRSDTGVLELFQGLRKHDQHLPIVLASAPGDGAVSEREIDEGVVARVTMPLRLADTARALELAAAYRESRKVEGSPRSTELFRSLVGSSGGVRQVRRMIEQVADTDATVLLLGESGTGKEVVARNVHYHSRRRYKPFVPLNCGAIPKELLESELFGHEKGAFTGAIGARMGRFEMADGGTLFLDEIGDMPADMQVKLLRVLQDHIFERVGSNKSMTANVRIVAATNADLDEKIADGRFREDLYYRLSVFPIELPPLRDRVEDLPLLVNELNARIAHQDRGAVRLTSAALDSLSGYRWPGNVRELANLVERLAILYPNAEVDIQDLPQKYQTSAALSAATGGVVTEFPGRLSTSALPRDGLDLKEHLNALEQTLIEQALDETDGVVAHAAKRLRMGRTTLVEKMRKFGINR